MAKKPLSILIDRELSSVEFIRDYMQFHFDGPTLTAITDPELIVGGIAYKRESPEFCNLVIGCVGQTVIMAEVKEEDSIVIKFKNGSAIFISLKPEDYEDVEAAWFDDFDNAGNSWIW